MNVEVARKWVDQANAKLRQLGIGKYDNGEPWCSYSVDDDGTVFAVDFNESIAIDWTQETDADIEEFADAYLWVGFS